jgi:hypothetical protein
MCAVCGVAKKRRIKMLDKNRKLIELLGIPGSASHNNHTEIYVDGKWFTDFRTPDGRIKLLGLMAQRCDWGDFLNSGAGYYEPSDVSAGIKAETSHVDILYVFDREALMDKVIEWLEAKNG